MMNGTGKDEESYDFASDFSKDSFIDAHDGQKWCVAVVMSSTPETVNIRFEAWSSKYDERGISKHSKRLAPFRLHSVGYTGQTSQPYRQFTYSRRLNSDKQAVILKIIESSLDSSILNMTPFTFTQVVRGDLFIHADSLLSLSYIYDPIPEDLQDIYAFIESCFRLALAWLKHFPLVRKDYLAAKRSQLLYLTSLDAAVAMAYPELTGTMATAFGGDLRRIERSFIVSAWSESRRSTY